MKYKKSSKDIAFDKERANYRHKIADLHRNIKDNLCEIQKLNHRISELEESIRQKDDWIRRLLEYTELSEEDMKKQIRKDKNASEILDGMEKMNHLVSGFGTMFGL